MVGEGVMAKVGDHVPPETQTIAVLTQQAVMDSGAIDALRQALDSFEVPGRPVTCHWLLMGEGESAKTLGTVGDLAGQMARLGMHRGDLLVAAGGGVVTDVGGFLASIYHRGIRFVNVATTLLAQVDAAVGGKTGVNLPEGKNLAGTFWHPLAVLCDIRALESLPDAECRSGMGELAKYAFLGAGDLRGIPLEEQVARAVAVKAEIVSSDERELSGRRMVLNYGHTLGHALEGAALARSGEGVTGPGMRHGEGPGMRHGEGVAIGIVFAARLAAHLARIGDERRAFHEDLIASFGLPTEIPRGSSASELVTYMRRDKKAGRTLTFVLDGPQGPEAVGDVPESVVMEVLLSVGCEP